MNYGEFLTLANEADPHPPVNYNNERVRVVDPDGFAGIPVTMEWNEADQCFDLRTKWED